MLNLKSYFMRKNGLIWEQQRIAIQSKQAIAETIVKSQKQRNLILQRKMRKLGGVVVNKSPLEKSEVQGNKGFSLTELLKQLISYRDAMYISSHWGLSAMLVFPVIDLQWYCLRVSPSGLLIPFQ